MKQRKSICPRCAKFVKSKISSSDLYLDRCGLEMTGLFIQQLTASTACWLEVDINHPPARHQRKGSGAQALHHGHSTSQLRNLHELKGWCGWCGWCWMCQGLVQVESDGLSIASACHLASDSFGWVQLHEVNPCLKRIQVELESLNMFESQP